MSDTQKNRTSQKNDDFLMQGMILAIAMVLTKVIGVVYRIPLTNILGDEGNGFYGYAYEVYAMALMLSTFSLPTAVSKLVSARMAMHQKRNAFRVFQCAMAFAIIVGVVVALLIFLGAGAISTNLMESPLSIYALRVLSCGLFIVAVLGVLRGYFQGLGTMVPTAISQVVEQIINAAVSIIGAIVLYGIGTAAGEKTYFYTSIFISGGKDRRRTSGSCIWCCRRYTWNGSRFSVCAAISGFYFFSVPEGNTQTDPK